MRVLVRLWLLFALLWFAIVIFAGYDGKPDGVYYAVVWGVPLGPLVLIYALRWAFKGGHRSAR